MGGIISNRGGSEHTTDESCLHDEDLTRKKLELHKNISNSPLNIQQIPSSSSSLRLKEKLGILDRVLSNENMESGLLTEPPVTDTTSGDTPMNAVTKRWATAHGNRTFFIDDPISSISPTANDIGINPLKTPTLVLDVDNKNSSSTFFTDRNADASFRLTSRGSSPECSRRLHVQLSEKDAEKMDKSSERSVNPTKCSCYSRF